MKNSRACNNDLRRMMQIMGIVENRQLFSEINEAHKEYTKQELNEIYIVEKQHVAPFKYGNIIDEIIEYIEDYIFMSNYNLKFSNGKLGWKFIIPESITKKIDFIKKLELIVTIVDDDEGETLGSTFGAGDVNFGDYHFISDNKIGYMKINVKGMAIDDELIDYSIRNGIYHELNHAYEAYKRQQHFEDSGDFKVAPRTDASKKQNVQQNLTGDRYGHMMQNIFYRLWDKSELSAAATSTYSYFKSNGGERSHISIDIQNTQAYHEYVRLKEDIEELNKYWDENFWETYKKLYSSKKNKTVQSFKNWFIKRSHQFLSKYFHFMLSAALLYFDENDEKITKNTALKQCCEKNMKRLEEERKEKWDILLDF